MPKCEIHCLYTPEHQPHVRACRHCDFREEPKAEVKELPPEPKTEVPLPAELPPVPNQSRGAPIYVEVKGKLSELMKGKKK